MRAPCLNKRKESRRELRPDLDLHVGYGEWGFLAGTKQNAPHKREVRDLEADTVRWLRRMDLNQRPSGYEPDELPTAPLRDIFLCISRMQEIL